MKHKFWFFVLIIILILFNVAVFVFLRYGNVSKKIKTKLSEVLSNSLKADVSIGNLSLNDKQLNISKLKIVAKDKTFSIFSKQIYVEFNIFSLLKSRFKNFRGISLIKIYNPKIDYKMEKRGKRGSKKPFRLPDLRNFFKRLEIQNGYLNFSYKTENMQVKQILSNINIEIKNKSNYNRIICSAIGTKRDSIFADVKIKKGKITNITSNLINYRPDSLHIKNFPKLKTRLNLIINKNKENTTISGSLDNNDITYRRWNLFSKKLVITGSDKQISILLRKHTLLDGYSIKGQLKIKDYLDNPTFNSYLKLSDVDVKRYAHYVSGKADAKVSIKGKISSPIVNIKAYSKKLKIETETFSNSKVSATYSDKRFSFRINDTVWEKNHLHGTGYITSKGKVVFKLKKENLHFTRYGINFTTNLIADYSYNKDSFLNVNLKNTTAKKGDIKLNYVDIHGVLKNSNWSLKLNRDKNITLLAKGSFQNKSIKVNIKLKHLKLSNVFGNIVFPITSGDIDFEKNRNKLKSNADIIFYDQNFGKFDGEIKYNFLIDYIKNKSSFKLKTQQARYNFEPFNINLSATGTADSLYANEFKINDKILAKGFFKWKPKPDLGFKIIGNNITPEDILKYFTDYETLKKYNGKFSFALNYNGLKSKNIEGVIDAKSMGIDKIQNIDAYVTFFGNKSFFTLDKMFIYQDSKKILGAQGNMIFKPFVRAKIIGKLNDLDLSELSGNNSMKGKLNGYFAYFIKKNKKTFDMELQSSKSKIFGMQTDSLYLAISQKDKLLNVINFFVKGRDKLQLSARGKLGYNIFSQTFFKTQDSLSINFKGDLLKSIKSQFGAIEQGKSKANISLNISTNENGLKILSGNFNLSQGLLKIKKQPTAIDKINIDMKIANNKMDIKRFSLHVGSGYLYLKNKITDTKKDFILANVNLGKILVKTNSSGILMFIPGYVPEGSFLNVEIKGRYSDYLSIDGPFDDIKIKGDVKVSNGSLVYPPHTENLLKIIKNPINTKNKESEVIYPFSLDLSLKIGDNLHYATYPINLLMKKGSYMNLIYKDGMFSIPDAFFISEKGSINIFGTVLKADYVSVKINKLINGFKLNAEFYKDIPDGTRVTLHVFTKTEKNKNKIQFRFLSDRAGDSTMDIISMLRFGKRLQDINGAQRNTLLQDELVQIAGLSIENAFITPLFYPFENFVKHLLKLDYFNIKTGFIQNVFNTYYRNSQNQDFTTDENKITKFGMDMFLNNLTLQFTKHIYKKTFLDYQVSFQKSTDLAIQSKMGIYQNLSLKFEMPYRFRLSLDYNIRPFYEKNSFQIGVEKSIKFY